MKGRFITDSTAKGSLLCRASQREVEAGGSAIGGGLIEARSCPQGPDEHRNGLGLPTAISWFPWP